MIDITWYKLDRACLCLVTWRTLLWRWNVMESMIHYLLWTQWHVNGSRSCHGIDKDAHVWRAWSALWGRRSSSSRGGRRKHTCTRDGICFLAIILHRQDNMFDTDQYARLHGGRLSSKLIWQGDKCPTTVNVLEDRAYAHWKAFKLYSIHETMLIARACWVKQSIQCRKICCLKTMLDRTKQP